MAKYLQQAWKEDPSYFEYKTVYELMKQINKRP